MRGCVTLLAALRGLDAPRSILTEKFWVLRLGATAIYVGRANSCSTQSAHGASQLNQLEINPEERRSTREATQCREEPFWPLRPHCSAVGYRLLRCRPRRTLGRWHVCAQLSAKLLGGNIKYANAQIVPANTAPGPQFNNFTGTPPSTAKVPVSYCLVVLSYSSTPANDPTPQNITIYVGLPLNSMDGGVTGSTVNPPNNFTTVEGNWNGRTEGQGGGGCTGNTNVNSAGAVANGFVGSGTDGGHGSPTNDPGNTCQPGVLKLGELNHQYIADWVYNGPQQEILWSKKVAELYYGNAPKYNYWNGCSTGGHQGYALAQTLAGELDGILANAPAMYWTRFQTAQMWGQIAMFDIAQEVIAAPKLAAVQNAAINACDKNDGVADGIIDDPRTCTFNAKANICGQPGAPAAPNCLTATEANAVNVMWDGPRSDSGNRIWFPIDRGTDFCSGIVMCRLRSPRCSLDGIWKIRLTTTPALSHLLILASGETSR